MRKNNVLSERDFQYTDFDYSLSSLVITQDVWFFTEFKTLFTLFIFEDKKYIVDQNQVSIVGWNCTDWRKSSQKWTKNTCEGRHLCSRNELSLFCFISDYRFIRHRQVQRTGFYSDDYSRHLLIQNFTFISYHFLPF